MTTMQLIKNAVEIVGVPVYANNYTGDAKEYCTINTIESPDAYGDDTPGVIRYTVALHRYGVLITRSARQLLRHIARRTKSDHRPVCLWS